MQRRDAQQPSAKLCIELGARGKPLTRAKQPLVARLNSDSVDHLDQGF
jgi:hypothetical protein